MKERKSSDRKFDDFVQILLDSQQSDEIQSHEKEERLDENGNHKLIARYKNLDEDEIIAQCILFFVAAFKNPTFHMIYLSYMLALHEDVQDKLFNEIKAAFDDCQDGEIGYDELPKLEYLEAVFCETLRLFPPLTRIVRQASQKYFLADTGLELEKGTNIHISLYALHRDPELFADPEKFVPERFLSDNRAKLKPYSFLPFGAGPRSCIGMRFALLETKLAMVHALKSFRFVRTSKTEVPLKEFLHGSIFTQATQVFVGIRQR